MDGGDDIKKNQNNDSGGNAGLRLGKNDGNEIKKRKAGVKKTIIIFFGIYCLKKGQGEEGNEESRKPVRLTKSGKDTILDVLDPTVDIKLSCEKETVK